MMNTALHSIVLLLLLSIFGYAIADNKHNVEPLEGYVPSEEVAINIALAVWEPIYGKEKIESEAPYNAELEEGIWIVTGSLPKGWVGGVALIEIEKKSGKILRVSHGQ